MLPALAWPAWWLVHTATISPGACLGCWHAGRGGAGRGKEGCKLVPQAVVARWWQVEEQE